jgi:hypothetical protein
MKMIGVAEVTHGLYTVKFSNFTSFTYLSDKQDFKFSASVTNSLTSTKNVTSNKSTQPIDSTKECNLWHLRFGHPSYDKIIELNKSFPSIKVSKSTIPCDTCFFAKQKRLPFSDSYTISANIFDLIHMDIWGPLSIPSMSGHRYFLTVVDDKSRFTWIYLMKYKSETSTLVKKFVSMIKTQFQAQVKSIRTDNGNEFKLVDFFIEHGIFHQCSCVGTP